MGQACTTAEWIGRRVVDDRGDLVGVVVDVYVDADSEENRWLAISTGFFGMQIRVAPLHGASIQRDDVVVDHRRAVVEAAPTVHAFAVLSHENERLLRAHYRLHRSTRHPTRPRRTR